LSRFVELARQDRLRLLLTDVILREVKSQLQEAFADVTTALDKRTVVLQQLGASVAINCVRDQGAALGILEAAFEKFLRDTKAINVPLISEVTCVLDDYFARRPPFGAKKKSEFPDAISIASLRVWCKQKRATAYIVSEDSDLRACCSDSGPLFYVASIQEIISHATVSQQLHEALEQAIESSRYLSDTLYDKIKEAGITIDRSSSSYWHVNGARIEDVHAARVISVRVLDQVGSEFTCELEVEAKVSIDIDAERESWGRLALMYEHFGSMPHHIQWTKTIYLYPEVVVLFDRSTGDIEFKSIYVPDHVVAVGPEDVRL
jgi:PIN domain-containing protein